MRKPVVDIILWIYLAVIVIPFVYLLLLSFSGDWRYPAVVPDYIGGKNWMAVLSGEAGMIGALVRSLLIALTVAFTSTTFGLVISDVVARHKYRRGLEIIGYLPYVVSPVVLGACLSYYFLKTSTYGTTGGVIVAQLLIACPYAVLFFLPFWGEKTNNYRNLVLTLSGTRWQAYTKVLLPLAKEMIVVCFFQTFLLSWFEYGITSVIGVGKVETLTIKVFMYIREANYYFGAVACCLLLLPPVLLLFINKKIVVKRVL